MLVDLWWVFRYRYQLAGTPGDPVPFWSHFVRANEARFARADGTVGVTEWQDRGITLLGNGIRSGWAIPLTGAGPWADMRVQARVTLDPPGAIDAGIMARCQAPVALPQSGYYLRVTATEGAAPGAPGRVDAMLARFEGGNGTELARRDGIQLSLGAIYMLELRCQNQTVTASLGEIPLFSVRDEAPPLPPGGVALWARGQFGGGIAAEGGFINIVVSDLTGR